MFDHHLALWYLAPDGQPLITPARICFWSVGAATRHLRLLKPIGELHNATMDVS